jgi:hypothetical protein
MPCPGGNFRGAMNCAPDALVSSAATDIAGHRFINVFVGGLGLSFSRMAALMIWPDWQ